MFDNKSIEFEGTNILLKWGVPIERLHSKFGIDKNDLGDRTIYKWGEQTILNGLTLNLTSRYWNFEIKSEDRKFDHLEFWATGDHQSKQYFNSISEHLIKNFGEPTEKDEKYPPDRNWKWILNELTFTLTFFEQHAFKLCFSIKVLD
jgi:hypothetical protein